MTQGGRFLPRALVLPLLLVLALTVSVFAQDTDSEIGTITGTVKSTSGAPLNDVRVLITSRGTGKTVAVRTNASGSFASGNLAATDYTVKVEIRSFIAASSVVFVKAGAASTVELTLAPEPVQGVVPQQEIDNLPLRSRNFLEFLQLEPGVQNQSAGTLAPNKNAFFTVSLFSRLGDATPLETDGLDITDRTSGGVVQNFPPSAVQEFQFGGLLAPISNQFYAPGAINVVTRSGGNDLHGSLFGFYGNGDILSASLPGGHSNNWGRQQYGGNLGGALVPDKFFFFLDAERNRQDVSNPILPAGPFTILSPAFTTISEPFRGIAAAGRLDYQASAATRAFYRFAYDQSSVVAPFSSGPNLQPLLTRSNTPSHTLGLDLTSESFVHAFRFEHLKFRNTTADSFSSVPAFPTLSTISTPFSFNIGGGSITQCASGAEICVGTSPYSNQQNYQSNTQFRYDGSRLSGKHQFHFGASFDRILVGRFAPFAAIAPTLSDPSSVPLPFTLGGPSGLASDPSSYPVQFAYLGNGQGFGSEKSAFSLPGGGLTDNQISLYGADTWKVKPNLAVTYGVRWTRDTVPNNSDLAAIPQLNALQPKLGDRVRQPNLNFAPQLGVAWDTSAQGTTTFRAGIGMFYDQSSFLNAYSDRALRLQQGAFFATTPACLGGASEPIQWPTLAGSSGTVINGAGIVNANGTVSPYDPVSQRTWCGESMGTTAPLASALQQAYQTATAAASSNPSFIGNPGGFAGPYLNGLSLMSPNYQTPRTIQVNAGLRHELRPGLTFTVDYTREVTTRSLLGVDANLGGSAGTFSLANALADRDTAQVANGCATGTNQVTCMVAKLGPAGALAAYGANGIGGPAQVTGGAPCPTCVFPGLQPTLGVNIVDIPEGRSVYGGVLLSLNQEVTAFSRGVQHASFRLSYSHSRNVSQGQDSFVSMQADDFANPTRFTGPDSLDRTHQFSLGALFDLRHSFQVGLLSHLASPLPVTLRFQQAAAGAEVLVTDWNGDGSTGDIIPGSSVGSYMRSFKASGLQHFIANHNATFPTSTTPQTPAGNALVNAGVFSVQELQSMGGVLQPLAASVPNVAGLGWFKTFDVRLGWEHHLGDRVTIVPSVALYNAFNFANFDMPGYTQNGVLNFGAGSLSPAASSLQPQNSVGGNSSLAGGRTNRTSLQPNMNASGAPRSVQWGLKVSF